MPFVSSVVVLNIISIVVLATFSILQSSIIGGDSSLCERILAHR